ncbi:MULTISPECIES: Gldg family protein [unclassified Pseudomonas]|uniref:Gldg family protein n=1 Tax=unclassified Pseudomonas TaxID=196821 RepID=UPI0008E7CBFF|nr:MULTISPECIES: Gldg family protein [unclassified Pseudomonas]PMV18452.1 ABC transporter [Pseudomonas sp. FW305-3-2-15-C-TSA2]PMV20846.1 ABC transporter [Pseudomonas sp. DP16D-L5]PMV34035.1 ABC transporter [Pseudomonas sp. FW305-3-2-15-A-LB2]PMV39481.1 ABC transporter [Pseudomonas sp. FW305-3-2-15-C-R2A1]PMV43911.1 ABC transporter [Pseudomonas sp. FW305-3-2-15-C-LB1]
MRSILRTGMTLCVTFLLFLAFNLVWIGKLPDIRWDLSQQKIHTLSPPVYPLLATLESPVDMYYFNSNNDPKRSYAVKRYGKRIEDLLKEYEKKARGMINLHVIEPAPYSEDAYKARLSGLDENTGFLGLISTSPGHGVRRIGSFSLEREPLLEYEISHLLYKLQHPERPVVGLLSGLPMDESAGRLLQAVRREFELVALEPNVALIPEHIKTLMVVQPRILPERTLYGIEQFVLRGGRLMMFIDPLSEQRSTPFPANSRLDEVLAAWGIRMPTDKLVVDSLYTPWETPDMPNRVRLNLPRQAMNLNDISTWNLNRVTVSSSGALVQLNKSRTTFTPILQSSEQSVLLEANQSPRATKSDSVIEEASSRERRHVIAARIEGPSYSVFSDGIKGLPPGLQTAAQIHVVVIADTDMLTDKVSDAAPDGNALFVLNTLDNLSAPDMLVAIRPRATQDMPTVLEGMREVARQAYRSKASELERRLQRTEQEWQRLSPWTTTLGTQAVETNTQLQALNKERLRLPMELNTLQREAYAQVRRLELAITLVAIFAMPLTLCLIAWMVFLGERRRRLQAGGMIH